MRPLRIVFWFSYLWKTKFPTDQKYLLWKGRVKPEVARLQRRWRWSWFERVFRVSVELSLEEMLSQRQFKACLYHGRDAFKETSWMFFHCLVVQYVAQYPDTSVSDCNNVPLLIAGFLKFGPEKIYLVLNMTKDSLTFLPFFHREINVFAELLCCPVSGQLAQYPDTTITT